MEKVIFACVRNAGRSQMAAALFNAAADPAKAKAVSAGTSPGPQVHPEVVIAMREIGIELSAAVPRAFSAELVEGASWLITMGCGDSCPIVTGAHRDDWPIEDPKGQSLEDVRRIRDEVAGRVSAWIRSQGWGRDG